MRFGLLHDFAVPRSGWGRSPDDEPERALEQAVVAEHAGFRSVWSLEHPVSAGAESASAPEIWLAAVAQRTERIRIGYGARLLPFAYDNPIRAAERAAVLDVMSGGRLELGTGRPATGAELDALGVDADEARAQWDEALHMIPKMWMQEAFSWDGAHFAMPARNVLPKPVQAPHPPLWMSGTGPDAAALAGERGVGFMRLAPIDPACVRAEVDRYRASIARAEPVGAAVHARFAVEVALFCGRDDQDAATRAGEAVRAWAGGGDDLAAIVERRHAIVGGPERCLESIEWYAGQGVDELLCTVQMGALAHDDVCDALRRFGDAVRPHFDGEAAQG